MLLVGQRSDRWQIAAVAAALHLSNRSFRHLSMVRLTGIPRDILIFAAFFCMGLFVYRDGPQPAARAAASATHRRARARPAAKPRSSSKFWWKAARRPFSPPIPRASILLANDAAHRLFGAPAPAHSPGRSIRDYLPVAGQCAARSMTSGQSFRTAMQCRGRREDGEVFLADVWFSTYRTSAGPRLAAMVVDTSEDLANPRRIQPAPAAGRFPNSGGRGFARNPQRMRRHRHGP